MIRLQFTIYARQGNNKWPDGTVGIHVPPLPSVTRTEVLALVDQLEHIARQMSANADPDLDDNALLSDFSRYPLRECGGYRLTHGG